MLRAALLNAPILTFSDFDTQEHLTQFILLLLCAIKTSGCMDHAAGRKQHVTVSLGFRFVTTA